MLRYNEMEGFIQMQPGNCLPGLDRQWLGHSEAATGRVPAAPHLHAHDAVVAQARLRAGAGRDLQQVALRDAYVRARLADLRAHAEISMSGGGRICMKPLPAGCSKAPPEGMRILLTGKQQHTAA